MADPTAPQTIELTMTPQGPLDLAEGYSQVEQDRRWQENLADPTLNGTPEGPGQPGAATAPLPSPMDAMVSSAFQAAGEGARNAMEGLAKLILPQATGGGPVGEEAASFLKGKIDAVRQLLLEGLGGVLMSPLTSIAAGARQVLKNSNPELEQAMALEPLQASFVRMMLGGGNPLKEGAGAVINQPMTVGEALDLAVQSAPLAAGGAKKVAAAVKEQASVLKGQRGALELPAAGGEPPPAGGGAESRLNVERIQASERVKTLMTEINKAVGESILAEHRKVQSHGATIEAAKAFTLEDALATDPTRISLAQGKAMQQAIRDYHVALGTRLADLEAAAKPGDLVTPEYRDLFAMQVQLAVNNETFQAAHARGLEALKILSDAERGRTSRRTAPAQTLALAARLEGEMSGMRMDAIAAMRDALTAPQVMSWQRQIYHGFRAGKDLFYAAWVQSLLSGWRTHGRNVIGSVGTFAFEAPEHFLAEIIGQMHNDPRGRMVVGETARALRGSIAAMADGVRLAAESLKLNEAPFEQAARERSTVEVRIAQEGQSLMAGKVGRTAMGAEAYGFDPNTVPGKTIDVLAKALNSRYTPGAALIVEDAFFKGMAYHMNIDALALREAWRGATDTTLATDIEASYRHYRANPTPEMVIEAQDQSILLTLNKELGARGQAFVSLLDSVPLARVMIPFVRWSTNAAKWFGQRAPILSWMSAQNWSDIGAKGVLRDKAIARMAIGHAVTGAVAYEVMQGNITGGSNNQQERALKPFKEGPDYGIRVGDRWITGYHQFLGAPGQMMAAVADYVDLLRLIPTQRYFDEWAARLEGLIIATGTVFANQTAMQGVGNVLDAIKDPQRSAGKEIQSLARSLVPTMLRDYTRASDQNIIREARSLGDAVRAGLPWATDGLAPFRHQITGEPRQYPVAVASEMWWPVGVFVNMFSPLAFTKSRDEVWAREIAANRIILPEVGWWINGTNPHVDEPQMVAVSPSAGVEISPWERDVWITQMTQVQKDGAGRTLQEALTHAMQPGAQYWTRSPGPQGGRADQIKRIYHGFEARGYMALLDPAVGSPTLRDRVKAQFEARMKAKLPVTDSRSPFSGILGR